MRIVEQERQAVPTWQTAALHERALRFTEENGFIRALEDGFFFLKRPPALDLGAGDRFAQNFHRPSLSDQDPEDYAFTGMRRWNQQKLGKYQGYFCRDQDQTEQFFLQSDHWSRVFPARLVFQAEQMRILGVQVLQAVLACLDIPPRLLAEATGGCAVNQGNYTLTFNHFRPQVQARGLNVHKDSGWLTLLRSIDPGLEVERAGVWCPIEPVEGTFIVNFGCAMEILTRFTSTPIAAAAHRVVQQHTRTEQADRFSYAMFLDSSLDRQRCQGLYTYRPELGLQLYGDFDEFLQDILERTYQANSVGLY